MGAVIERGASNENLLVQVSEVALEEFAGINRLDDDSEVSSMGRLLKKIV
jgi:hypothetical protein